MKQFLTPEDINFLEQKLKESSPAPWSTMESDTIDTVWVVPSVGGNPIALFDYQSRKQNVADADFVVSAKNYFDLMLEEIKNLRRRILELIQSNNVEVQKRQDLQEELKKILRQDNETN